MAMQHIEDELRRTGDPRRQAFADVIAGIHKSLGEDILFPSAVTLVETRTVAQTPETPVEIKRFSQEQREALEKEGFVIYGLTGQSIKTLRDGGRKFRSTLPKELPDFEALGSMHSEVAIHPSKPFLPKSNNKTLAQQEKMVEKFSQGLGKKVQGVKAIIGQAPDYEELAFRHLDATREHLFGAKDIYNYARTKTPTGGSRVACVGDFRADRGLGVGDLCAGLGHGDVRAAPLVVPV